jgi:hypothetical protein
MTDVSLESARAAKARALQLFEKLGDVVGIGLTKIDDTYGLKVNLRTMPSDAAALPTHVDGVPVKIEIVGTIRKQRAR